MMEHPCKGLSQLQIDAFEQVAVGMKPPLIKGVVDVLEKRGVIVRSADLVRRDALGEYTIPQWEVPIQIHAQWCAWCAENVEDDKEHG